MEAEGNLDRTKRAFTLLEVLIAVGVLFIIGSAVVSLSNTLIQGTIGTADTTVTNLWAQEGLELVAKNRDDRNKEDQNPVWLAQAKQYTDYGWYYVALNPSTNKVELTRAIFNGNQNYLHILKAEAFADNDPKAKLQSEGLNARRFICVEALGASSINSSNNTDRLRCNLDRLSDQVYNDGARTISNDCYNNDVYCVMTKASLNKNNALSTFIPPGNAVKVRSVIVWQTQRGYRTSEMSTILTNWRSIEQ